MKEEALSIEAIDAHIANQGITPESLSGLDVCGVYRTVRPVLVFAKTLLFFKPAWQPILQGFIDAVDKMCSVS
jgi:hypothetical protein